MFIVENALATATSSIWRAFEFWALCFKISSPSIPMFFKNDGHAFEDSGSLVSFWEIKVLRSAVFEISMSHLDFDFQRLTSCNVIYNFTIIPTFGDFNSPICPWLWCFFFGIFQAESASSACLRWVVALS